MILISGKIIATLTRFGNLTSGRRAKAIAFLHFMFFYLFIVRDRVCRMFLIDRIPDTELLLLVEFNEPQSHRGRGGKRKRELYV